MKAIDDAPQRPKLKRNRIIVFLVVTATVLVTVLYIFWYWISPVSAAFEIGSIFFSYTFW
jgi:hypothetical protein